MKEPPPQKQIPPERKALYYTGMGLTIVGVLLFLSTFVSGISNFGNFEDFDRRVKGEMCTALCGMGLMVVGGILMRVGAVGAAGSGFILDPEQARKDVEPWARMGGGVADDALSEIGLARKLEERLGQKESEPKIKVRCRQCQALNDETAKFCNQCGATL
jgi:hypothetical protein